MSYRFQESPPAGLPLEITAWLEHELTKIMQAGVAAQETIRLKELNASPARPRTGDTVLADGTNWNPGAGRGVYTYYAGAWNKLG